MYWREESLAALFLEIVRMAPPGQTAKTQITQNEKTLQRRKGRVKTLKQIASIVSHRITNAVLCAGQMSELIKDVDQQTCDA